MRIALWFIFLSANFSIFAHAPQDKKVMVLGGDGFCGWATSLYLSEQGYDVSIVDNLSRRKISQELHAESLTPICSIDRRLETWKEITGKTIHFYLLDIASDYQDFKALIETEKPDVIIHFAEQRSAPYSMKNSQTNRYTVSNNLNATNNVLNAIVETGLDIHLVHLGTMGVYGYGAQGDLIPEGYLKITTPSGNQREILHPADPGSIYHMTKCQDQLFFYYYNKNYKTRITDLHQGIVWGTNTKQTLLHDNLINRFDYDSDYGTVLNRFLIQAACNVPLTVYGEGGQKRAFIHITDMVKCLELAIMNPPSKKERVKIFNQMTETYRVIDLARKIHEVFGCEISYLSNPRNEAIINELDTVPSGFLDLNLNPVKLSDGLLTEILEIAQKYKHRVQVDKIQPMSFWRKNHE